MLCWEIVLLSDSSPHIAGQHLLHINGRPGYLSRAHINLEACRHRARSRVAADCCSEMCWVCLLRPSALCAVPAREKKNKQKNCCRSEGWSLSLEKSLKDLQKTSYELFWDYCSWIFCQAWNWNAEYAVNGIKKGKPIICFLLGSFEFYVWYILFVNALMSIYSHFLYILDLELHSNVFIDECKCKEVKIWGEEQNYLYCSCLHSKVWLSLTVGVQHAPSYWQNKLAL